MTLLVRRRASTRLARDLGVVPPRDGPRLQALRACRDLGRPSVGRGESVSRLLEQSQCALAAFLVFQRREGILECSRHLRGVQPFMRDQQLLARLAYQLLRVAGIAQGAERFMLKMAALQDAILSLGVRSGLAARRRGPDRGEQRGQDQSDRAPGCRRDLAQGHARLSKGRSVRYEMRDSRMRSRAASSNSASISCQGR